MNTRFLVHRMVKGDIIDRVEAMLFAKDRAAMSDQLSERQRFFFSVSEPKVSNGSVLISFVPRGLMQHRNWDGTPNRLPKFVASAFCQNGEWRFDWSGSQDDPGPSREELEAEAVLRLRDRERWLEHVQSLVTLIEQWGRELGWTTRQIEKTLDDNWIGKHVVPALLLQESTRRILLEPVGRSTEGAEGMADLYLMPAYDDIARLFFLNNEWHWQIGFSATASSDQQSVPLSKESLNSVLSKLTQHAA